MEDEKMTFRQAIPAFFRALDMTWQFDRRFVILTAIVMIGDIFPMMLGSIATARFNEQLISRTTASYGSAILPLFAVILINLIDYTCFGIYFWVQEKVTTAFSVRLLKKSVRKAMSLDYAAFDDAAFYDKVSLGWSQDGMTYVRSMQNVWSMLSFLCGSLAYFSVLMWLDWRLLLLLLVVAVLYNPLNDMTWQLKYRLDQKYAEVMRREAYYRSFFDTREMSAEGKLYDLYDYAEQKYEQEHRFLYGKRFLYAVKKKLIDLLGIAAGKLPSAAVSVYLTIQVFQQNVSIANMVLYITMFEGFLGMVYNTVGQLSGFKSFARDTLHAEEFMHLLSSIRTDRDAEKPDCDPCGGAGHRIEFRNVTFRYPGTEKNILENVSFRINPGEMVSVIGRNGAGKTTMMHLLMRLYDPTEGAIFLDGADIRTYSAESYYQMFGVLFQDYCTYAVSAKDAVTLSVNEPDAKRLEEALRCSAAKEITDALPKGLETVLSRQFEEDGTELSGGQKQRMALARAYYKDAPILIFDEPSASIDPIHEAEMLERMQEQKGKKTLFVISHRLSSCVISDRILLLSDGRLTGCGTHRELLKTNADYAALFHLQADRYRSADAEPEEEAML